MENTQPTRTRNELESQAAISDGSIKSGLVAATESAASMSSSQNTTATMSKGSKKTLTSAVLAELQSKTGLVAGALADFQTAGGMVALKEIEYTATNGKTCKAVKMILIIDGANLVVDKTEDGLDIGVQPLPSGTVAEVE